MSGLVERLVARWHKEYTGNSERDEARWWLNAIADELEREDTPLAWVRRNFVIHYLRSQAKGGTDD